MRSTNPTRYRTPSVYYDLLMSVATSAEDGGNSYGYDVIMQRAVQTYVKVGQCQMSPCYILHDIPVIIYRCPFIFTHIMECISVVFNTDTASQMFLNTPQRSRIFFIRIIHILHNVNCSCRRRARTLPRSRKQR